MKLVYAKFLAAKNEVGLKYNSLKNYRLLFGVLSEIEELKDTEDPLP